MDAAWGHAENGRTSLPLFPAVAFLGGIFAWLVSVPLFGPVWLALAASAHVPWREPVYLFLAAHAVGLASTGLIADVWAPFRRAGLIWAAPACFGLTLLTALSPSASPASFPVLGLLAAWGIVSWAPAFQVVVPLGRRALSFAGVPVAANAFKYLGSLGLGHVSAAWLVVLAALPLLGSTLYGWRLVRTGPAVLPSPTATRALPPVDLRPLWLLAPFLFVVYLSAGVSYSAVTPSVLATMHASADMSLISYVAAIPLLALLADRISLRSLAVLGPLLLGGAFLVWAAAPTRAGAFAVQGLMGAGYAAMDLLTWVALLEIAPPHGTSTVFGIGLNVNVLPILIGAGLQAQMPLLARLPSTTLAGGMIFLMLVAVAFFRDTPLFTRRDDTGQGSALAGGRGPDGIAADGASTSPPDLLSSSLRLQLTRVAQAPLSPRELDVACLVVQGHSLGEVAQELVVSENTVKTHLASVYRKTGTRGRADLSARVLAAGGRVGGG